MPAPEMTQQQLRDVRLMAEDEWSQPLALRLAIKALLARYAALERLRESAVRVGQAMLDAGPADDNGPTPEVKEEYYKAMDELKFLAVEFAKLTPTT